MRWLFLLAACVTWVAAGGKTGAARVACYVGGSVRSGWSGEGCTHVVYTGTARGDKLEAELKDYRKLNAKILLRVDENDKDLKSILKSKSLHGLEVYNAHRTLNKTKVSFLVEESRAALTTIGGGPLFVSLPANPELLAKYYDVRGLAKTADVLVAETHALGVVNKMTFHPSRLSGVWDMMNTDSVVDLIVGLGAPASKVVITLPVTAQKFRLANETLSTPGSPTLDDSPQELDRRELCQQIGKGKWTMERDQDLSAPYAFKKADWIAFEDFSSVDVKSKYARVRGLAGLALTQADSDAETDCGPALLAVVSKVLNKQKRAPRGAVLRSLESEILSSVALPRALDELQVSPYRITQVVDSDGVIHSLREDTRTEFSCSRQGYFVHPRTCARFYRCVKFDQLSPDYTVFEFDCPAGLAFDSRYEVCVWPGSLPDSQACPGSSEIAPVPRTRFVCPEHEGYYADPENCRWFFACMDHGKAPLSAYEFRCPFGLGFDASRLLCDWPWLVPGCGNIARYEAEAFGYSGAALSGATGFHGQSADSVNIAAHQSLVSGASLNNLVGVQGGYLSKDDALNANFIAAEEYAQDSRNYNEYANGYDYDTNADISGSLVKDAYIQKPAGFVNVAKYDNGNAQYSGSLIKDAYIENQPAYIASYNLGLANAAAANNYEKYASEDVEITGSLIKDEFRERKPTIGLVNVGTANVGNAQYVDSGASFAGSANYNANNAYAEEKQFGYAVNSGALHNQANLGFGVNADQNAYLRANNVAKNAYSSSSFSLGQQNAQYKSVQYDDSSSGQYVNDNSGAYVHDSTGDNYEQYKHVKSETVPYNHDSSSSTYKHQSDGYYDQYDNSGYKQDNSGEYRSDYAGAYIQDNSGSYKNEDSGQYVAGVYRNGYDSASYNLNGGVQFGIVNHDNGLYNKNHNDASYSSISQSHGNSYQNSLNNQYITDSKIQSGVGHTLTAGAVNVGLVGKTTLVEANLEDQYNYNKYNNVVPHGGSSSVSHTQSFNIHNPSVSVTNVGSGEDAQNINYDLGHVTTVSSVGVAPTVTPIPVTTPVPITTYTYRPTFTPVPPKTDIKAVFGYQQPAITFVQPTPTPAVVVTAAPQVVHATSGYSNYNNYQVNNYQRESGDIAFSVSQSSKEDFSGYDYPKPAVAFEEPFKKITAYTTGLPPVNKYVQPTVSTYAPPAVSYFQPSVNRYVQPPVSTYVLPSVSTYVQPAVSTYAPPTVSTYRPHAFSQQTIHKVEPQKFQTVTQAPLKRVELAGYDYPKPAVSFFENPLIKFVNQPYQSITPVTAAPSVITNYQTVTPKYVVPNVQLHPIVQKSEVQHILSQPAKFEIPSIKQSFTYQPTQETFLLSPEIQRNIESLPAYKPSAISHQVYHQSSGKSQAYDKSDQQSTVTFVSTTPSNVIYEDHYEYKVPVQKQQYVKAYTPVSSTPATFAYKQEHSVVHAPQVNYEYKTQDYGKQVEISKPVVPIQPIAAPTPIVNYEYQSQDYVKQVEVSKPVGQIQPVTISTPIVNYEYQSQGYAKQDYVKHDYAKQDYVQQVEFQKPIVSIKPIASSTPIVDYEYKAQDYERIEIPKPVAPGPPVSFSYESKPQNVVESVHFSSLPVSTTYRPVQYDSPYVEVQQSYKAREYLPPVVPTTKAPEYLPPVVSTYSPPTISTTAAPGYLPPVTFKSTEYLPPKVQTTYIPVTTPKPAYKSTTQIPTYTYKSTTPFYKAPEYLPPIEDLDEPQVDNYYQSYGLKEAVKSAVVPVTIKYNPIQEYAYNKFDVTPVVSTTSVPIYRKQNIVVQTAKAQTNLLGFGTVGPDAGLILPPQYSTTAYPEVTIPVKQRYTGSPNTVSTYAPYKQEIIEVTPAPLPARRIKPKIAVVTKINDFNPLLVRKLGAVCSCQSPVLVLRGKKPAPLPKYEYDVDYNNDYDGSYNEDIDNQWSQKSEPYKALNREYLPASPAPIKAVTSTFNPIIVPDDSYYQDYQEENNARYSQGPSNSQVLPKQVYSDSFVSSTYAPTPPSAYISSTQKIARIRPRIQSVTVAPTIKTILVPEPVTPVIELKQNIGISQPFDRYGPGGLRSRDETLQGTVDCKRAGLFRHPKHCNKFYACRWDCTKERFTLHVFNCPVQLSFDPTMGACNWPSQGPSCQGDTLLTNGL